MKNSYDQKELFNKYYKLRKDESLSYNDAIEIPTMKKMLGDISGKKILDLGCGYGNIEPYLISSGAKYVLGIDSSEKMIETANKENKLENVEYKLLRIENLKYVHETFDIVISSLAFHYVEDFDKLLKDIYAHLNPCGILIFSQWTPLSTAQIYTEKFKKLKIILNNKKYFLLSDYSVESERSRYISEEKIKVFHRKYSTIINCLINNKFIIESVNEPLLTNEIIKKYPEYKDQIDKPSFMFIRAHI